MLIDIAYFPFIWLRDRPGDEHDGELKRALLDCLLDRKQRFVIIAERPPRLSELNGMSLEEQAEHDRFLKTRRSDFQEYCGGLIVIAKMIWLTAPLRSALQGLSNSSGVPLYFVDNEVLALELARERLRR